jgi:hypothetical protein
LSNTLSESFVSVANVKDEETAALLFRFCLKQNISRRRIEDMAAVVAKKGDRSLVRRLFEIQENDGFPNHTRFTKGLEKLRSRGIDAMVEHIMERAGGVVDSKGKTWGNALQEAALVRWDAGDKISGTPKPHLPQLEFSSTSTTNISIYRSSLNSRPLVYLRLNPKKPSASRIELIPYTLTIIYLKKRKFERQPVNSELIIIRTEYILLILFLKRIKSQSDPAI